MPRDTAAHTGRTRQSLLTAAERLFLSDGFDNVSVRAVCAAAGANPAAVHYHFGSKDELTIALLEARLGPLWSDVLDHFRPGNAPVDEVVGAVLEPLLGLQRDPLGHLHLRLLSRFALSHPSAPWTGRWFRLDSWAPLLTAAVPGLDDRSARRRWALAFQLILTRVGSTEPLSPGAADALAEFVTAGLAAPTTDHQEPR